MTPHDKPSEWTELMELLASPDPTIRDGWALELLAEGILNGHWASQNGAIQQYAIELLRHPEAQARAYAPLVLCWLVQAGARERQIFDSCRQWYLTESDERGYDRSMGWLHSIAHGADVLGFCAQARIAGGEEVLQVFAEKIARSTTVWEGGENERIISAIIRTLCAQPDTETSSFFRSLPSPLTSTNDPRDPNMPWQLNLKSVLLCWYICMREGAMLDDKQVRLSHTEQMRLDILATLRDLAGWLY